MTAEGQHVQDGGGWGRGLRGAGGRFTLRGSVLIFAAIFALIVSFEAFQLPSRRRAGAAMLEDGQLYTEQSLRGPLTEREIKASELGAAEGGKVTRDQQQQQQQQHVNCSLLCPMPPPPPPAECPPIPEAPPCPVIECPQPQPCPVCPPALDTTTAKDEQAGGEAADGASGAKDSAGVVPSEELWSDPGFHYYPFDDMFYPYNQTERGPRSLVLFTAGRSGMENVDRLVRLWGMDFFDYVLLHFDDSSSEWGQRFDWYQRVVSVTALRQAKFWYYKRFASPWAVKGYRYVHFVDSDAGSPEERPFDLREYEDFLARHKVLIGQPAISDKGRSSDHMICRVHKDMLFRWTSVVENGPLYSVAQEAYDCYWRVLSPNMVSGWGPDTAWCPYLYDVCGFPKEGTCAVVDVYYIDHLDKKTASGQQYRGRNYWDFGFEEWALYKEAVEKVLKSPYQANPTFFHNIKMNPLPEDWAPMRRRAARA